MSAQLISRSTDLSKLRNEGFEVATAASSLVIGHVPYVAPDRTIKYGTLVSELTLAGERTAKPGSHTVWFAGETPCASDGRPLNIGATPQVRQVGRDLTTQFQFSQKPQSGYSDYYEKMTTYAAMLVGAAQGIDPSVTAQKHRPVEETDPESPFVYSDTATARAGLYTLSQKMALSRVILIGLGGSGSYLLDFLAKSPVKQVDVYDGDVLLQHNAFRSPGAVPLPALEAKPMKADYYCGLYSAMHRGIVSHPVHVDETNVDELEGADFVFVCIDDAGAKRRVFAALERFGIPFIDVGMGLSLTENGLIGQLRATLSTPQNRAAIHANVSLVPAEENGVYEENIQIAELNALNAIMAIIRWKKWCGVYVDEVGEHHTVFDLDDATLYHGDTLADVDDAA